MINVFLALNIWKERLRGSTTVVHCDNMAVVCSLSSGRSWDDFLGKVARNVWLITATYDIDLIVKHIPGKQNDLADALSRWYSGHLSRETVTKLLNKSWVSVTRHDLQLNECI